MWYINSTMYPLSLFCLKMSFLLIYLQLFPKTMVRLRRVLFSTIALVVIGYAATIAMLLFWCMPISANWSMNPKTRCLSWAAVPPYFFSTALHLITDLIIFILPFLLLPTLYHSASRQKLLRIAGMFSLGFLCILCT